MNTIIQLPHTTFNEVLTRLIQHKTHLTPYIDEEIARIVVQNSVNDYDRNIFFDEWKNYHIYYQIENFNTNTDFSTKIYLHSGESKVYATIDIKSPFILQLLKTKLNYPIINTPECINAQDALIFDLHDGKYKLDNSSLENIWEEIVPNFKQRTHNLVNDIYYYRKIKELKGSDWTQTKLIASIQHIKNTTSQQAQQQKLNILYEIENKIKQNITLTDLL